MATQTDGAPAPQGFTPARTAALGHIWSPKPPAWLFSFAGIFSWSPLSRSNHTTAIIPTPRLTLIFATKHNLSLIVTVQVSKCHLSPWPGPSLRCCDHEHKQKGEVEQKILPIFHTFKCGHHEESLRACHCCSHARNAWRICFTSPRNTRGAADRCQILSKNFASSKALDAWAYTWLVTAWDWRYSCPASAFSSPWSSWLCFIQAVKAFGADNFQGGCRGSHKAAPHLPSKIPVFLPGWEQDDLIASQDDREELLQCPSLRHSAKEFSHKGQVAAAAHTGCGGAVEKGILRQSLLNPQPLLQNWRSPKSW